MKLAQHGASILHFNIFFLFGVFDLTEDP